MVKNRQRNSRMGSNSKHQAGATQLDILRQRQLIFEALAKGLEAGLTPAASLNIAIEDIGDTATKQLLTSLESGSSVTHAIKKHGLSSDFDNSLIRVGETSGRLASTTQFIAGRYERIISHKQRLKSKLTVPLLVGLFAIVVIPLPNFVAGTIAPERYFAGIVFGVVFFVGIWRVGKYVFQRLNTTTVGYPAHYFADIPLIGELITAYSRASLLERLHLLYASGYPLIEATELSHESLVGFARRVRYRDLTADLHQGYSLADTFEHHEVLGAAHLPLLATGEAAGKLEEMLCQIARELRAMFDQKITMFVTWFPRVVYALITIIIVSKIL